MGRPVKSEELQKQINAVVGKHVYGNMYGISERYMTDIDFLTKLVIDSARAGNMHIIELITKKFPKYNEFEGGVSVIALIQESHIALHTWPESSYLTIDIYSCGSRSDPDIACRLMLDRIKPKKHRFYTADRGSATVRE
ncbi:MAG: adenosylmethionine decarboxylase [Candidatus Marsarchaeota archaeon]|jgi:S-adenosylmethionine decarboxylase|nr:adenosylmethionine decarboxylase [Candidatus Marsarchaeota archaeon]